MSKLQASQKPQTKYWNPYLCGSLLGIVLFAAFALTGHGLGASGGLMRLIGAAQGHLAPAHVTMNPELAKAIGGEGAVLDHWLIWIMLGVLIGGFVSGLLAGRLKLETYAGPRIKDPRTRWALALIGGVLVGIGSRMARGCTSGQALSGGAVLSVGSFAFMMMVFAGGYALAYFVRRLWN